MFISMRTVMLAASGNSGYQRSMVSSRVRPAWPSPMICNATVPTKVLVMLPILVWLARFIGSLVATLETPRVATHSPCPGIQSAAVTPGIPESANASSSAASSLATRAGSSDDPSVRRVRRRGRPAR